jgi:hypothetical protein
MRWPATISCYEQRHAAPTVGIDAFCGKSPYSWLEHYTPFARRRPTHHAFARRELKSGVRRGRQDSNLRPLVPQTSPHFPMSAEVDLECFRREMVGMTTRVRVMESAGTRRYPQRSVALATAPGKEKRTYVRYVRRPREPMSDLQDAFAAGRGDGGDLREAVVATREPRSRTRSTP